ncbi:protein phosphatase 2C domain-containing protein [Winogradskya consettensis]|uniref:Protein phosphatase n=1 Tax=Winogradskya consettensis TaxID=113560 RepID=A0A919SQ17_9ACTN|nr:protein phosphatase [Actinoplanes consettensis]
MVRELRATWDFAGHTLTATAGSVTGNRYDDNYDVLHLDGGRVLAVIADGMGDGAGSRAAGRAAADVFVEVTATTHGPDALRAAVAEVQLAVREAGRGIAGLTGCTLTAFVGDGSGAWLVQLGDSRAYRLRDGLLELLTVDHTAAWLGLLHGWYAAGSAEAHAAGYQLTRYAGHPGMPEPDLLNVGLRAGDVFLLCTDGVSDQIPYERLAALLSAGTVTELLEETLRAGGKDNATAVIIRVKR